jgi:predicted Zn-dependent protease
MQDKIRFYEEILSLEPGSKLFYPLARLYLENQELDKAHKALASGLEKHPEFLQARLLLLEVLSALDKQQELEQHLQQIWSQLGQSQEFWRLSAEYYQRQGDPDLAVAVSYLGRALQGQSPGWVQLLLQALQEKGQTQDVELASSPAVPERQAYQESSGEAEAVQEISTEQEASGTGTEAEAELAEEELQEEESGQEEPEEALGSEDQYKTPTMAEIRAEQGDLQGALEIYSWLLEQAESSERQEELQARMQELQQKAQTKEPQEEKPHNGQKKAESKQSALVNRLERLASRLESRGQEG